MQFKAFIVAAMASVALAQTATSSAVSGTTSCAAQNIADSCAATIEGQINSCATTDYTCLCTGYTNLVQCYAPCASDPNVGVASQQRELNCNNASVYGTTTTLGTASATSGAASATTTGEESAQTGFASASGAASSETGAANAAENVRVGGGVFAVLAAGVVALL